MGLFNRIDTNNDDDTNCALPDTDEDITVHGCAVYFDILRLCQSIPGRLKGWYRYGELRDCSPYWRAFSDCMKHTYFYKASPEELDRLKEKWMNDIRENSFGSAGKSCKGRNTIGMVWEKRNTPPEDWMNREHEQKERDE